MITIRGPAQKSLLKVLAVNLATTLCAACALRAPITITKLDESVQAGKTVQLARELRSPAYAEADMLAGEVLARQVMAADMPVNRSNFPIVRARGLELRSWSDLESYPWWIDDNRLVVLGGVPAGRGLFIWDIRQPEPTLYRAPIKRIRYFPRSATLLYGVGHDGLEKIYRGAIGQEVEISTWAVPEEEYRTGQAGETGRYSTYLKLFFEVDPIVTRAGLRVRIWNRDFTHNELLIPPGPWLDGSNSVDVSRLGLVFSSQVGGKHPGAIGNRGLYLVRGDKVERLVAEEVAYRFSVSPDGCKIAYRSHLGGGRFNLEAVNLCVRGE